MTRQIVGTSILFLLLGTTAPGYAQDQKPDKQKEEEKKQPPARESKAKKAEPQRGQQQGHKAEPQRGQQPHDQNAQQQHAQAQNRPPQPRLSHDLQQQRIVQQQQRVPQYAQALDQRTRLGQQQVVQLQQQHRTAQYGVQQAYVVQLQQQQSGLRNDAVYDYNNDPYFYTPYTFRYSRGGAYYETNQYGADLLRQAVNYGYNEGFRSGQADRQDRWAYNYHTAFAYQDANYGYRGYYVGQSDYHYYFREGFSRGYSDGYYGRYQYGRHGADGRYTVLGGVMSGIAVFVTIR
jgi:hypothetical protein